MSHTRGTLLGAGLLLFVVGCGGGASSPDAAFKDFQAAVKAKDADKAWNLMTKEAQGQMDTIAKGAKEAMDEGLKKLEKLPADERKKKEEEIAKDSGMSVAEMKAFDGKK